ncbi:PR domain zinc finger protein 10 isoform X1 [Manduca sexta]|uniref:PR domain zinc finger protein 10 isoform X1 n=3 Tax=Manduca sexta TaxID=7130 RepID=UPI00188FE066|nr:PR domain zinc finger protein 10 isoform X1 [Manduca sexta]
MNPSNDILEAESIIIPFEVMENTYLDYDQLHHFTPLLTQSTELTHALKNPIQRSLPTRTISTKNSNDNPDPNGKDHKKHNSYYVHISDRVVPQRAIAVLPTALRIRRGVVTPRRLLPPHVRFGPIQGIKQPVSSMKMNELILNAAVNQMPIFFLKGDDCLMHIDMSDRDKSNWMCLLPLGNECTANIWIFEEKNELYGMTTKSIPPRKPLMLGYSKSYAQDYGLPGGQPVLDLNEASTIQKDWWCLDCGRPMATSILLQQHKNTYHKEDIMSSRRRYYHCRHCKRKFCRLYTLKRHLMSRFCLKNVTQPEDKKHSEETPDAGLNISTEDHRISSDESFQNYSNGLDFSTNLFDDRMSGLDISVNSRGVNDFIPYTIDKEENLVANLGFISGLDCTQSSPLETGTPENNTQQQKATEPSPSRKPCNQTVTKKKKKPIAISERRFSCHCGRVYTNKEKLAKHVHTVCSADHSAKPVSSAPNDTKYKCETCDINFKRRGMLVNHLWRVHNSTSAAVPLEKRIRHYPCVACPKIYSSAAKRNQHVTNHHPEAQANRASWIEGGVERSAPAACGACPRQYGTRAKLLQHVRAAHPQLQLWYHKLLHPKRNASCNPLCNIEVDRYWTSFHNFIYKKKCNV